jgi:hypothetical protein
MARILRLIGGLVLLLICIGGILETLAHIRAGESTATVVIAAFTLLILLAFAMISLAMMSAGLARRDNDKLG